MLTLKHLAHLRAIAQHGSILAAAEHLHLSQSALTRSLNTLEKSLGVRLFDRAKSGMTPTAFCRQIESQCRQALLVVNDIKREADIYRNIEGGELRVAVGRAIKSVLARRVLPEFMSRYADVSITISEGAPEELVFQLKNRKVDLLIAGIASYREFDGISHQPIADIPLSAFVRPEHTLVHEPEVGLEQLSDYPLISAQVLSGSPKSHPIRRALPNDEPVLVCGDYAALKAVLLRTDCWLLAPAMQFDEEQRSGELYKLPIQGPELAIELSTIEITGRSRTPVANEFVKFCHSCFAAAEIGQTFMKR